MKHCFRFLIPVYLALISFSSPAQDGAQTTGRAQRPLPGKDLPLHEPSTKFKLDRIERSPAAKNMKKNERIQAAIEELERAQRTPEIERAVPGQVSYVRNICLTNPALPQCKKPDPKAP